MSLEGSIRAWTRWVTLGAAVFALAGCDSVDRLSGSDAIVAIRDSQYRIDVELSSPDSPDTFGELRVHVEPQNGWKFALEAPASLRLEEPAGFEFEEDAIAGGLSELEHRTRSAADAMVTVRRQRS